MFSFAGFQNEDEVTFLDGLTIWVFARGNAWRSKMLKRGRTLMNPTTLSFIEKVHSKYIYSQKAKVSEDVGK
jgi:hypothetical protein